jgi:hydroxymethylpyrimidine/phosphomethylpyrimidine kinase
VGEGANRVRIVMMSEEPAKAPSKVSPRRRGGLGGILKEGQWPCALTIAGLDPGGGAGIAADLRAFAKANVFGCAAIAVMTVQSTQGLKATKPVQSAWLEAQCKEVLAHQTVRAIKIGALGSSGNAKIVAAILEQFPSIPSVLDTVMVPTRGEALLLGSGGAKAMARALFPHVTLVTCNALEASELTGLNVRVRADAERAALALLERGAKAVLVKGGHLKGEKAVDVLARRHDASGEPELLAFEGPRSSTGATHGGGCILASLIAGKWASARSNQPMDRGRMVEAIVWAKRTLALAFQTPAHVGGKLRVFPLATSER